MILFIEKLTHSTHSLALQIEHGTGWPVCHVEFFDDAIKQLYQLSEKHRIGMFTMTGSPERSFGFVEAINKLCATRGITRPLLLALSNAGQPAEIAARLDKMGVPLFLRKYPEQILETVKKLQWQACHDKNLPSIVIQRRGGYVTCVEARFGARSESLNLGPRLANLAAYFVIHAKSEHSTEVLADATSVSRRSVKEYLLRLRRAFDAVRLILGCPFTGDQVFWTRLAVGGHIHGIKANVEIEDSDDYYFPEERDNPEAPTLVCSMCREERPRGRTTRFRLGSICLRCSQELQALGEL